MANFNINRTDLKGILANMKRVLPKAGPYRKVMRGMALVCGDGGKVTFTASDIETSLTMDTGSASDEAFEILVSLAELQAFVTGSSADAIAFEVPVGDDYLDADGDNYVKVSDGMGSAFISATDADRWPVIPMIGENETGQEWAAIMVDEARSAFEFVSLAASTDETRYNLNGLNVDTVQGFESELILTATDGHRLNQDVIGNRPLYGGGFVVDAHIVPLAAAKALLSMLPKKSKERAIEWGRSGFTATQCTHCFRGIGWTVAYKRIDGEYPNWRQVVPKEHSSTTKMQADADALRKACEGQVKAAKAHKRRAPFCVFEAEPDTELNEVSLGYTGETWGRVPAIVSSPFKVGVNAAYLRDALKGFAGKEARIAFGSPDPQLSPMRVSADGRRCAVVMPARL